MHACKPKPQIAAPIISPIAFEWLLPLGPARLPSKSRTEGWWEVHKTVSNSSTKGEKLAPDCAHAVVPRVQTQVGLAAHLALFGTTGSVGRAAVSNTADGRTTDWSSEILRT